MLNTFLVILLYYVCLYRYVDELKEDIKVKGPGSFNMSDRIHMAVYRHPTRMKRLPLKFD